MNIFFNVCSFAKKYGSVLCFVFFVNLAAEASQDDISTFLLGAREDSRVLENQDNWRGAGMMKTSKIPLEDVELRADVGSDGIADYVTRISFGSFSENRAEAAHLQANEAMLETRYNVVLNKALHSRYRLILSVMGLGHELVLGERRIALLEKQVSAYKNFVGSPEFRFAKLMDAEQDLDETRLMQIRLQRAINTAAVELREYGAASESSLSDSWLKSVDEVMQVVNNSLPLDVSVSNSPFLANTASAVLVAEKQLDLQRTKDNIFMSFIDVGYDPSNAAFSTRFAVKIPFGSKTDRAVVEAKTRLSTARREQQLLQHALPQQLGQIRQTLQKLHEAYRLVVNRLQDDSHMKSALSDSNPLTMYRIFENTLHWELEEAEIRQEILEHYVEMLHLSGQLAIPPLRNYLSKQENFL